MPDTPRETSKAAAAYAAYEAMGPDRSLRILADKIGTKLAQLGLWSKKYAWQARVAAYDADQIVRTQAQQRKFEAERARRKAERELRRDEQRDKMEDVRVLAFGPEWVQVLRRINKRLEDDETRGLVGLVSLLKTSLDEERQSLGGATQTVALSGQMSIQHEYAFQDDPEAAELARTLMRRMGTRGGLSDTAGTGPSGE